MTSNLRLSLATTGCFACVLAGIVCDKIRATAGPTTAECIPHAESVDQKLCTIDGSAVAASICGGDRCCRSGLAISALHWADATLPFQ
jgi:hypothetical protein